MLMQWVKAVFRTPSSLSTVFDSQPHFPPTYSAKCWLPVFLSNGEALLLVSVSSLDSPSTVIDRILSAGCGLTSTTYLLLFMSKSKAIFLTFWVGNKFSILLIRADNNLPCSSLAPKAARPSKLTKPSSITMALNLLFNHFMTSFMQIIFSHVLLYLIFT